nr:PREDICTED: uncharacterized protein LOC105668055 [Linepithema humile]
MGQDLFNQTMTEGGFELGVVSEPYRIQRDHPNWFTDPTGEEVAISWRPAATPRPCSKFGAGHEFVAIEWGEWVVLDLPVGAGGLHPQMPPPADVGRGGLQRVVYAIRFLANQRERRGDGGLGGGTRPVSFKHGFEEHLRAYPGESIVDLTWASPSAARRVTGWWVDEDLDSGSNHRYIVIEASTTPTGQLSRCRRSTRRRWVLRKINEDILMAVILMESWPRPFGQAMDLEEEATRVVSMVENACEASMLRSRWSPVKAMHWWTEKIAELRRLSSAARRTFLRARRKRGHHTRVTEALGGFVPHETSSEPPSERRRQGLGRS